MKTFEKLSRAEMKNVLGGVAAPPDDCTSECTKNSDCPSGKTCQTFNLTVSCPKNPKVNICGNAS